MKFTEALEKFGSAPKETHDWADDPSLSAEEITARFNALPEVTYDFERNVWEVER